MKIEDCTNLEELFENFSFKEIFGCDPVWTEESLKFFGVHKIDSPTGKVFNLKLK